MPGVAFTINGDRLGHGMGELVRFDLMGNFWKMSSEIIFWLVNSFVLVLFFFVGYYDKYLQEYFNRYPNDHQHQTQLIGLGFREQIIDDLPTEASHDVKLDIVLSA